MTFFYQWFIYLTNPSILFLLIYIFDVLTTKKLKGNNSVQTFFGGVELHYLVYFEELSFGFLVLIKKLFIVEFFVLIYRIRVNWYWNWFLGVIANYLWYASKLYIWIFSPHIIEEICGKGDGWVFIPVDINWLFCLI